MLATNYRRLDGHKVNPANDVIDVAVMDGIGPGGAHHHYGLQLPDGKLTEIHFQNGPIAEAGVNGLTHEALLAVLIDRMECFQKGPFKNDFNASALFHLRETQAALHARTKERMARNVEGTHQQ
jgi:hypothetical protein